MGSTIEGAADIEADLAYHDTACWETGYRILRLWTEQQARARIESLAFQRAEGPTQPGRSLPAQPTKLELEVKFGIVGGTYTCGGSHRWRLGEVGQVRIGGIRVEGEDFLWLAAVKGLGAQLDISTGHVMTAATIDKGWTFSGSPFKAEWKFHDPNLVVYDPEEPEDATVEVTLTHEPS